MSAQQTKANVTRTEIPNYFGEDFAKVGSETSCVICHVMAPQNCSKIGRRYWADTLGSEAVKKWSGMTSGSKNTFFWLELSLEFVDWNLTYRDFTRSMYQRKFFLDADSNAVLGCSFTEKCHKDIFKLNVDVLFIRCILKRLLKKWRAVLLW